MPRKLYNEISLPEHAQTVLGDRIGPMRAYFNALPGSYNVNDCSNLQEVKDKYPELFVDDTHRLAVLDIWIAGGHMLDQD